MACAIIETLLQRSIGEFDTTFVLERAKEDCPANDFVFVRWPSDRPISRDLVFTAHILMIDNHLVKYRFGPFVR